MKFLPIFLDTRRGPILLVGAGDPVRARLRLLLAAEARVRWHATDGDFAVPGLDAAAASRIERGESDPRNADLGGIVAVFCAGAGEIGESVAARALAAGVPINVMDDPARSSFIVPAIVDRGDVVAAIGTGGASPVVARRVRERIEAVLPARIGDLAAMIGRWRKTIHDHIPDLPLRRRFWERVIDGSIGEAVLAGRADEAESSLKAIVDPSVYAGASVPGDIEGRVTLVGAGPGDPDLLTVKALRALQDADVIFYDELITPEILDRARRDAVRVPVGRRVGKPGIGQDAINRLLIDAARSGRRAVRLKGGDPFIFGRGGEEAEALREAGVACSVIPGITAALGAAAESGVPLTYRHEALRVTFLTAHKAHDASNVDWSALTDRQMTVVVYMGITAAPAIRDGLLAAGRSPQTPVGVFARATRPDAKTVVGMLDHLPALVRDVEGGPAILVIGDVVSHSAQWRNPNSFLRTLQMAAE